MNTLTQLLGRPTAGQLAQRELEEARTALLNAQSAAEYFQAIVTYNQQRVARLEAWLNGGQANA
jgi:hypothetical protein